MKGCVHCGLFKSSEVEEWLVSSYSTNPMKIGAVIVVTYVFAAALLDVPVEMLHLSGKENLM
jgi:hypothetical protein